MNKASSFRAKAIAGSKAPKPSGLIGSHHKASDSPPKSPTTPLRGEAHGGKVSGSPSGKVSAMNMRKGK
jgi:hypothetical protein